MATIVRISRNKIYVDPESTKTPVARGAIEQQQETAAGGGATQFNFRRYYQTGMTV